MDPMEVATEKVLRRELLLAVYVGGQQLLYTPSMEAESGIQARITLTIHPAALELSRIETELTIQPQQPSQHT
jgi:hypothetical protein